MEVSRTSDREIQFNLVKILASDQFTIQKGPLNIFISNNNRYMQFVTPESIKMLEESMGRTLGKTKFIDGNKKMNFIDAGKSLGSYLNDIANNGIPNQYGNFSEIWKSVKEKILPQILTLITQKSNLDDYKVEISRKKDDKLIFKEINIVSEQEKKMKSEVKEFEVAMKNSDWEVRKKAIGKFSDITEGSVSNGHLQFEVTLPKLFSKYKTESNEENRLEILRALGRTTYNYPIDLDQKILLPRPGQTILTYKKIMPQYKKAAVKCIPTLLEAIDDSSEQVRGMAISVLADFGPLASKALPKLNKHWKSTKNDEALRAINRISKGKVDDIYTSALEIIEQKKTDQYSQAINILGNLDKEKIKKIESKLLPVIKEDKEVKGTYLAFELAKILVKIENDDAVEYLV
ncbi:MAG: HEAT repeat domain-containing protein, partial [Candidatus Heimdallarchaeota archaeon]